MVANGKSIYLNLASISLVSIFSWGNPPIVPRAIYMMLTDHPQPYLLIPLGSIWSRLAEDYFLAAWILRHFRGMGEVNECARRKWQVARRASRKIFVRFTHRTSYSLAFLEEYEKYDEYSSHMSHDIKSESGSHFGSIGRPKTSILGRYRSKHVRKE